MAAKVADFVAMVERDGFAVVPDVLGIGEVSALIDAIDRVGRGPATRERGGGVYALRDLLRLVPEVRELASSVAVRGLVAPVLGPDAFPVRGLLFDKTPGANWGVPWHRDLTIAVQRQADVPGFGPWTIKAGVPHVRPPRAVLERMLTLRLHLDDCDERNGPLHVLPGSHLRADQDAEAFARSMPAVACPVRQGGALIMRPLLLHSSPTASAPGHRRVVHLEFAADPLPDGVDWFESCV